MVPKKVKSLQIIQSPDFQAESLIEKNSENSFDGGLKGKFK
jgi:hypothetical protein